MEKIASFCINHDTLTPGIYTSRIDFDDIVTYDIRFCFPNAGRYLSSSSAHTVEHLFATWVRSSRLGNKVVYFGPMGCLTGFYLILKGVEAADAVELVLEGMAFVRDFEGDIPGAEKIECGNYIMHDLISAKRDAAEFCEAAKGWNIEKLVYPE